MTGTPAGNILLIIIAIIGWIVLSMPIAVMIGRWIRRNRERP